MHCPWRNGAMLALDRNRTPTSWGDMGVSMRGCQWLARGCCSLLCACRNPLTWCTACLWAPCTKVEHHLVSRELLSWQPKTLHSTLSVLRPAGLLKLGHRLTAHELTLRTTAPEAHRLAPAVASWRQQCVGLTRWDRPTEEPASSPPCTQDASQRAVAHRTEQVPSTALDLEAGRCASCIRKCGDAFPLNAHAQNAHHRCRARCPCRSTAVPPNNHARRCL